MSLRTDLTVGAELTASAQAVCTATRQLIHVERLLGADA
jgi:hypothetical protein